MRKEAIRYYIDCRYKYRGFYVDTTSMAEYSRKALKNMRCRILKEIDEKKPKGKLPNKTLDDFLDIVEFTGKKSVPQYIKAQCSERDDCCDGILEIWFDRKKELFRVQFTPNQKWWSLKYLFGKSVVDEFLLNLEKEIAIPGEKANAEWKADFEIWCKDKKEWGEGEANLRERERKIFGYEEALRRAEERLPELLQKREEKRRQERVKEKRLAAEREQRMQQSQQFWEENEGMDNYENNMNGCEEENQDDL